MKVKIDLISKKKRRLSIESALDKYVKNVKHDKVGKIKLCIFNVAMRIMHRYNNYYYFLD